MNDRNRPTASELGIGRQVNLPSEQRATSQNWTLAPYNRWTFQRVQEFTNTTRVPRAPQTIGLKFETCDLNNITFTDSNGHQSTIDEMLTRTWTDGFLVMHRGKVLTEQYFNGMKPETLHLMMSCSKSFTSALAGIYIESGQLDPSSLITEYIPELANTGFAGASVQQALDMRVGVKFSEDYDDLNGDWRQLEVATGWRPPAPDYSGPSDFIEYAQTLDELEAEHGGTFHYKSILTDILGICLERVTGRPFNDLFAEHIWHPIGAEQELVSIVDSAGTAVFEGGFNVCLRDFGRFADLICNGGRCNDRQLVPASWIDECRSADTELIQAFALSDYGEAFPGHAYHNKWWIRDTDRGVIMALGIHGQTLFIDPQREFVVAKFSSQPGQADITMATDQMLGFEAIVDAIHLNI